MGRVLIVKLGAIGDAAMLLPGVDALRAMGNEIDWVCGTALLPLLAMYPFVGTIPVDERVLFGGALPARANALVRLWRALAGRSYDLCATMHYDWRYRLLTLPVRARRRIVLSDSDRATRLLAGRHHTDEYARILLGLADDQRPISLAPVRPPALGPVRPRSTTARPRVVLAPAGARNVLRDDALRRWPVESYAALTHLLLHHGAEVTLIGGPDDGWASEHFAGLAVHNRIGALALAETVSLLDASDVLVTHDTGPLHLAGITGVGIVSIFGPTDPRGRLPQRAGTVALWGGEGFACRPCYDGRDYAPCHHNGCVRQVPPEMVMEQVKALVEQQRTGTMEGPRILAPPSTVTGSELVVVR